MPFAKCRYYTESGEPVKGGCHRKGAGCDFIHPDDPNWDKARPPKQRNRDRSGDSGGFKYWGERSSRGSAATSSGWDTGENTNTDATGTLGGGGWGAHTETGWGTGSGWNTADSSSTQNPISEPAPPANPTATKSWNTSTDKNGWGKADDTSTSSGDKKGNENGWGNDTGSGWGSSSGTGTWGTSRGNTKESDKAAGSGWGNAQNDGNKTADNVGSGWGAGWGSNKNAGSWGASDPMTVDDRAEKGAEQRNTTRKAVPAPPRIRIPDNEKNVKITGTNNEPLGTSRRRESWTNNEPLGASKWGESHASALATASTPATPITALTPTDATRVNAKRKRDVAFDEKFDVFKEYVKSWERGVRARFLLAEAEAKRDRWFRTQKSTCYARIGEAGRKTLDGQRSECDKEVTSQREKLSAAITSLVEFHGTIASDLDLGQRYNVGEEAQRFIIESRAFVDDVRALLVAQILKDKKSDDQSGGAQTHYPSEANSISMDNLRSQFRDLEERFDQAQAELTLRHQRDVRSEIDELLSTKIADLRVARQREIDRIASQPRPEIVITPAALMKIDETAQLVRELDAKIPRSVEDIRVLLLRVDATTNRVNELEKELSTNKETYRKMQEMAAEKEDAMRTVDARLQKIREQFEQLVASQSPDVATRPAPNIHDSRDQLMESLGPAFEAILDKFYEREIRPSIESMQQNVINASDRLQAEAVQVLWGRIKPAMNMVSGVSRWLDSQELVHTAPVDDGQRFIGVE